MRRVASRVLIPALAAAGVLAGSVFAPSVSTLFGLTTACVYTSPTPTVTNVAPNSGTLAGGTSVTVTGTQFCNGAVTVNFGATAGTAVVVTSNTSLTVTSPAHAVGTVDVTVTTAGGTSAISTADQFTYTQPPCATAGLASDLASPQQIDFKITFTASSTVCPNPEYLFYLNSPGTGWAVVRGYGGPVWVWDTSTLPSIGNFVVDVWVRQIGSGVPFQQAMTMNYTITNRVCGGAGLVSDLASPQQIDFKITFTATSNGCANPEYLYYLQSPGTGWAIARTWGGPVWMWDTSTLPSIGTFAVDVWVRAIGSGGSFQSAFVVSYSITNRSCTAAGLVSDKVSPQAHGAVITFTASSASCARPEYLFYLHTPGTSGTWMIVQNYGSNTWVWYTAGVASIGLYDVDVWVRAIGSGVPYQVFQLNPYTLT